MTLYFLVIFGLFVVTFVIIYIYYNNQAFHLYQINKIKLLEEKYTRKQKEIDLLKQLSSPCPISNLNDPRSCYFKSKYQCSWNDDINRCDLIR